MTLEIKTSNVEPIRQNYAYIERRFGSKPATRYQEVSFDVQAETNFHYRPLWKPEKTLNDKTILLCKCKIGMHLKIHVNSIMELMFNTVHVYKTPPKVILLFENVSLQNICLMKSKLKSSSTYCHFATLNKLQTYT